MQLFEPKGYDFHCHLDLYKNRDLIRRDIEAAQIVTFAMTTTPRAFEPNIALFGKSAFVEVGLGIHPELAATREADLALFSTHLKKARVIGEIGLDGRPQNRHTLPQQTELLKTILGLSVDGQARAFSFHSPRAVSDVLDSIEGFLVGTQHVTILHWFTGTKKELQRAADLGCYFSVNRAMCRKASFGELLRAIPNPLLLTETDGPFVKDLDVPVRPSDVIALYSLMGDLLGVSADEISTRVRTNSRRLLSTIEIV